MATPRPSPSSAPDIGWGLEPMAARGRPGSSLPRQPLGPRPPQSAAIGCGPGRVGAGAGAVLLLFRCAARRVSCARCCSRPRRRHAGELRRAGSASAAGVAAAAGLGERGVSSRGGGGPALVPPGSCVLWPVADRSRGARRGGGSPARRPRGLCSRSCLGVRAAYAGGWGMAGGVCRPVRLSGAAGGAGRRLARPPGGSALLTGLLGLVRRHRALAGELGAQGRGLARAVVRPVRSPGGRGCHGRVAPGDSLVL